MDASPLMTQPEPAYVTSTDPLRPQRRGAPPALLIRQIHAYISVFLAPTILFLSVTGCLQVYSLHEAHGDYVPPPIIEKLASVHKDQVFRGKPPRPPRPAGAGHTHPPPHDDDDAPKLSVVVLKAFMFAAGVSLIVSTGLGLWIALAYTRQPKLFGLLLALGTMIPLLTFALP